MNIKVDDRVIVVKDIFVDENDPIGCVGKVGTVLGFDHRIEVLLDGVPVRLSFDEDELELVQ